LVSVGGVDFVEQRQGCVPLERICEQPDSLRVFHMPVPDLVDVDVAFSDCLSSSFSDG
jgi:hypothetical protein